MAYLGPVRKWDVFWANLEPVVGREHAGNRRPVLVVSADSFSNSTLQLVMVVPLTKQEEKTRKFFPFEVVLPRGVVRNEFTPVAETHQLRSISKQRLLEPAGRVEGQPAQDAIEDALLAHLGIE
ncbi:MAG TPA: type II toxin-antitoxin system PemK/MazF family toxin [Longimicrobium sp.]|jgi:mRNA-degrading endonuclease toxin of MazEF toxin-antitoxin module|nr:type II toxin-antitoxin system PemK/MazF family toxin [Longimicrobium sp.]